MTIAKKRPLNFLLGDDKKKIEDKKKAECQDEYGNEDAVWGTVEIILFRMVKRSERKPPQKKGKG